MQRSSFPIAFYLLVVFLSGITVGAFGYRMTLAPVVSAKAPARPSPEEWRKQYLNEMETRLKLTPAQFEHLNSILNETRARYHDARDRHDQLMKTIKEEQRNKVRAILTEAQRPEYEKLRAEREARAAKEASAR